DAEFPEPTVAARVLAAIGADDTAHPGFKDVLSTIGDAVDRKKLETALTRSLTLLWHRKKLIECERPAWAAANSRLRRYRLTDPYLRFWFRYVDKAQDQIARGRADLAQAAFRRDWSSWRGRTIEPVIREALDHLAVTDSRLAGVESVRPWWTRDNQTEIDVVALTATQSALLGTIKWRPNKPVSASEMRTLRHAGSAVPRSQDAVFAAISPSGEKPEGADVAFGAEDLLAAW
ncbi:MAG: DUF234 domain-containing protein, partial [Propionibacteriaceae bacterium]|nr:DUF234 domain-containing protein [Propionibacteriaceae bacterium]